MGLIRTVAPAVEPVTLAEAKLHLRAIDSVEDSLITLMISAARRYAEAYCQRSLITQQWRLTLDEFPCRGIMLERGTVQSVQAIHYLDMAGAWQTITSPAHPDWAVDLTCLPARICPGFGRTWPNVLPQIASVRVDYTAGFGPAGSDVPEEIRNWLLVRVNTAFENREQYAVARGGELKAMPFVDMLLDEHRVVLA